MEQAVKDIVAGFISGWFQVIIMQPFEIVKIRLQTQSHTNPYYNGMVDCVKKITKEEGILSFYKGTFCFNSRYRFTLNWYRISSFSHVFQLSVHEEVL
jgi:hypothetical protein